MKSIFITATNTNVGKTYTTLKLIKTYSDLGYRVGVLKPIETGVDRVAEDGAKLLKCAKSFNHLLFDLSVNDIVPIKLKLPAAPIVANNLAPIDLSPINKAFDKLKAKCDLLLIEGAGGILTPINLDFFMIDLIKLFDAKTLLVCDDKLGSINTTLLNLAYLDSKKIDYIWAINRRDSEFEKISKPFFETKFEDLLYIKRDLKEIANSLLSL